ncbi:hypothetical protein [Bacillus alkalicellulosilyticus]|uniref:hypothetical protein n=1 Tax=Alkalihalobacterium alkalicellulosilyticum TaxID=1912214 RepID=UPI000996619E|nr:hypothetical protein [Bacillus alkalicellulosilyticus]
MNKKLLLSLISGVFALSVLAACGGDGVEDPVDSNPVDEVEVDDTPEVEVEIEDTEEAAE